MDVNFEHVKTVVRSLLTSSKTPLTIQQLLYDYKYLEGIYLPYRKLGYNSVVDILLKMDDVLSVSTLFKIALFNVSNCASVVV